MRVLQRVLDQQTLSREVYPCRPNHHRLVYKSTMAVCLMLPETISQHSDSFYSNPSRKIISALNSDSVKELGWLVWHTRYTICDHKC